MAYLIRRRKLGNTSCREITRFSRQGIQVYLNDHRLPQDPSELVFRWGCTSKVPQRSVVNTSQAIHKVADKASFRADLEAHRLCPRTWFSVNEFLGASDTMYPVVVRPATHHQGRNLHVCSNLPELRAACSRYPRHYISKLINKTSEFRVFVVSSRVVAVAKKTPANPNVVAWNVAQGGRFDNVRYDDWPLKAVKKSIEAFDLSGLDFGGVDVMVDAEGQCYILEINAAPSLTSPYRQECMAKAFDYIVSHGKAKIPLTEARGGYLKFIHPAINERAIV